MFGIRHFVSKVADFSGKKQQPPTFTDACVSCFPPEVEQVADDMRLVFLVYFRDALLCSIPNEYAHRDAEQGRCT
jgi:hypothetical protein